MYAWPLHPRPIWRQVSCLSPQGKSVQVLLSWLSGSRDTYDSLGTESGIDVDCELAEPEFWNCYCKLVGSSDLSGWAIVSYGHWDSVSIEPIDDINTRTKKLSYRSALHRGLDSFIAPSNSSCSSSITPITSNQIAKWTRVILSRWLYWWG